MNARRGTRARLSRLRSAISRGVPERVRGAFEECGIGVLRQDVACAGAALHGTVVQEGNEVACISSRFRAVRPHVRLRAHYPLWRGAAPPVEKRRAASDRRCGIRYGFRYCTMCSIMRHPIRDLSAIPTAKTGDGRRDIRRSVEWSCVARPRIDPKRVNGARSTVCKGGRDQIPGSGPDLSRN